MKTVPLNRRAFDRRTFAIGLAGAAALACNFNALAQSTARQPASNKVPAELGAFGSGAQWQMQGTGALRFFGFKAYDANLWVTSPVSAPSSSQSQNALNPHSTKSLYALEIIYNTGIKAEEIVNVSLVEMARLRRVTEAQLKGWTAEMQRTFPSVVKGDRLTGLHVPNGGTRFFFNSRLISEINDPAFGDAFFAIWLDEGTKRADLRKQLLGQTSAPGAPPPASN